MQVEYWDGGILNRSEINPFKFQHAEKDSKLSFVASKKNIACAMLYFEILHWSFKLDEIYRINVGAEFLNSEVLFANEF